MFEITERVHNGLRLIAQLVSESPLSIAEIAKREHISEAYLEEIARLLRDGGIIAASRGRKGGYHLLKDPKKLTVHEIVVVLEGPIQLVPCHKDGFACPVERSCATKTVWGALRENMKKTLEEMVVADFV